MRALLQRRADVNAPEPDGTTALHWAAHMDDVGTAELLIGAGANPKAANRHRVTPLALAATNGNAAMIGLLLKAGADPNTALPEGETALMTAARTGKLDAVKVLLETGANVNVKEASRGQTALMWAAAEGHTAVVEALTRQGADIGARSTGGLTALLFAVREGKIDAVRALLKAGANVNDATIRPPGITRTSVPGYAQRPTAAGLDQRAGAGRGQRAFRAGLGAAGGGRRSECGRTGLDGVARNDVGAQVRAGRQQSVPGGDGRHGQPGAGATAGGARRECECAHDAESVDGHDRVGQSRGYTVPAGGPNGGCGADAPAGQVRGRPAAAKR